MTEKLNYLNNVFGFSGIMFYSSFNSFIFDPCVH